MRVVHVERPGPLLSARAAPASPAPVLEVAPGLDERGRAVPQPAVELGDVFQLLPAQVRITAGHEHVRCVRLSEKGLMRWYAGCCKTPIGNTLASPRGPFIGIPHTFWDHASDGRSRDEALGPILSRTQARYGKPPLPPDSHPRGPLWLITRFGWQLLRGLFTGGYKPSPVFDASGKPIVEPTIVSPDDRERLRALCGPG